MASIMGATKTAGRRTADHLRHPRFHFRAALTTLLTAVFFTTHGMLGQTTGTGIQSPVARFASQAVAALQASGNMVDRENISRYFATYPVATDQAEAQRLLGTVDRILRAFAVKLQRTASARANGEGSAIIQPAHVVKAIEKLLPREPTPFKTVIFFPQAPSSSRVSVELIDLEAFAHTPFPWGALLGFAADTSPSPDNLVPLSDAAAPPFSQAVSDYGLLIFRLGGLLARQDYARELASPHLRQAEKAIAERAMMTGGEESTPATAPAGPFVEVAREVGINYRHLSSDWLARFRRFGPFAPTFSGGGVAAGDLDGDSLPDLIYCGGEGCAAYRNTGDGRFEDITASSGLGVAGEARMAVIADLDNDGDREVFITYARDGNHLFENLGRGRFRDVSTTAGVGDRGDVSGPVIAFDYDNDGLLDLYVGRFGDYLDGRTPWQAIDNQNAQPNRLFRNVGNLRFEDVTRFAGVGDTGWAQAISHVDYNLDGFQDIYISNDFGRNELYENRGDGTFEPRGESTGTNDEFHGMNVAFADFNRDSHPDIFITNIWGWLFTEPGPGEYNKVLLSNPEAGRVSYEISKSIIPELDQRDTGWSWAALFFDADNDSDEDLYLVNGHSDYSTFLQYRPHPTREGEIYPINNGRETNLFFRNDGGELRVPAQPSGAELGELNSRSIALLDFDQDGDLDIAVSTFHEYGRLFRNDLAPAENNWLTIELVGDPSFQVTARGEDGLYVWRTVTGGEGYLGMNTLPVEIGLGRATSVDLEIHWPGRRLQEVNAVPANRVIRVQQGKPGFETVDR
jgi:hypothetical protein